ncbi:uncharacterized protein LOC127735452 [Mytilus californianus]|uniref:uncharacterized protein LOC127735452 n=1 Tax=Mytilus californianus TaxID=6549 RepID=UPI0022481C5D|nr:uncharacterized protein LOC127735452 [Mytilus californianus]
MSSQSSQKRKFLTPFISPLTTGVKKLSENPTVIQKQYRNSSISEGRRESSKNEYRYNNCQPKSPKRTLYIFKEPLENAEIIKNEGTSKREKRYLIQPAIAEKNKHESTIYEITEESAHEPLYNIDTWLNESARITGTKSTVSPHRRARESCHQHPHSCARESCHQHPHSKKGKITRKTAATERQVKLNVLCSILKMKNELQIIRNRREKLCGNLKENTTYQEE